MGAARTVAGMDARPDAHSAAEDDATPRRAPRFDLSITGNRIVLAVVLGWVAYLLSDRSLALGFVLAVVVFLLATLIVAVRSRRTP